LDIAVRKLVGRHYHLRRTFGQQTATLYQWERCASPEDRADQAQALKSRFQFPRERFAWYKSADLHTVKKALPWKPILTLVGCIIGIGLLAWVAANRLGSIGDKEETGPSSEVRLEAPPGMQYTAESLEPAVPHWPWSAPFYQEAVKIASVPRIVGCMSMLIDDVQTCRCHNGQGDANVPTAVCRDFIAGRVFDPTREVIDAKAENIRRLEAGEARGRDNSENGGSSGPVDRGRSERSASAG
jgi:zona occludens toxin